MPCSRTRLLILVAALALLGPALGRAAEPLRTSGTGTALGTMRLLAAAFERAAPGQRLVVLPSVGSSGAFKAVALGAIDIGLSARALRTDEFKLGLVTLPYARTPFVLATGRPTGQAGLTPAHLAAMYRGEIGKWPSGDRVRLVLRPKTDADTQILQAVSPELKAAIDSALAREGMLMAATNQECTELLARTPGALGAVTLTQIITEKLTLAPLAWNGVEPTLANLTSGAYPLEKPLFLVIRAPATPAVRRFVAFLATEEAREIIERTGNIPIPLPRLE